jgi:hypothetical protein
MALLVEKSNSAVQFGFEITKFDSPFSPIIYYRADNGIAFNCLTLSVKNIPVGSLPVQNLLVKTLSKFVTK